jgi:xylose isomerase
MWPAAAARHPKRRNPGACAMIEYFPEVKKIKYEGPRSRNPLSFKHYNPAEKVLGKTMADHLRFSVCYWHTFKGLGADPFGPGTIIRKYNDSSDPMQVAQMTLRAAFEFFDKLGVKFWCFHDRDIAPEGRTLAETNKRLDQIVKLAAKLQRDSDIRLLWGTANLFSHRRYMAGAATNPSPAVFAHAAFSVTWADAGPERWKGRVAYAWWSACRESPTSV